MRSFVLLLLVTPITSLADALDDCEDMFEATGVPEYMGEDPPEHVTLCRDGYVLAYNVETKIADWVLEDLTKGRLVGNGERKENFKEDEDLEVEDRSTLADYKGSGFDRGHMAPAADMKFSQFATDQSFFLSNMAPQVGSGFNQHIWKTLESAGRDWAKQNDRVIVITGPVYDADEFDVIGPNEVFVATHFYKVVYDPDRKRVLAFKLPNKKLSGRKFDEDEFRISVDDLEELTGIDFLKRLHTRTENRLERGIDNVWRRK